jgi:hypothetical protein
MHNSKLLSTALVAFVFLTSASAFPASMDEEIDFLLDTVANSDCIFTRNGKDHAAADARDHLQMKRKRGARYFDSSEEFIEKLASKSSWSGKPYFIQCGSEPRVTAKEWFSALLENHRIENPQ